MSLDVVSCEGCEGVEGLCRSNACVRAGACAHMHSGHKPSQTSQPSHLGRWERPVLRETASECEGFTVGDDLAHIPRFKLELEAIAELEVDVLDQLEAAAELAMLLRHVELDLAERDLVAAVAHGESLAEFALASGQTGAAVRKRWQRVREKFTRACHAFDGHR